MTREEALKILGVQEGFSEDEIKKSYRKLALKYHPDRNQGDKDAENKFKEIASAYEYLTKPQTQDSPWSKMGPNPFEMFKDFENIFNTEEFFGFRSSTKKHTVNKKPCPVEVPIRFPDIHINYRISIEQLLLRQQVSLNIEVLGPCLACLKESVDSWKPCEECNQTGEIQTTFRSPIGVIQQKSKCQSCGGAGWVSSRFCMGCKNKFIIKKTKTVLFNIPADLNLSSAMEFRLAKAGSEGWRADNSDIIIHPNISIPDYSTLSEEVKETLLQILGKV